MIYLKPVVNHSEVVSEIDIIERKRGLTMGIGYEIIIQ